MINRFVNKHRFLSNFYLIDIPFEGETYPSVEHAFQAAKTTNLTWRKKIQSTKLCRDAKRVGQKVPLKPFWDNNKLDVMSHLLLIKFSNSMLKQQLLDTGEEELIESNWWGDSFWGVDGRKGGQNHLGKLLMEIRSKLREEAQHDR